MLMSTGGYHVSYVSPAPVFFLHAIEIELDRTSFSMAHV